MTINSLKYFLGENSKNVLIVTDKPIDSSEYKLYFNNVCILILDKNKNNVLFHNSHNISKNSLSHYNISDILSSFIDVDSIIVKAPLTIRNIYKLYPAIRKLKKNNKHLSLLFFGTNTFGYNILFKKYIHKMMPIFAKYVIRLFGFNLRGVFFSRYCVDFGVSGFVDLLSIKSHGSSTDVSDSAVMRLKEKVISSRFFMSFWPYYIISASSDLESDYITSLIGALLKDVFPNNKSRNLFVIDRYIMGNANVDVLMFRILSSDNKQYVARIPNDRRGEILCERGYSFIKQYSKSGIGTYIPSPLVNYQHQGISVYVESKVQGFELISYENNSENITKCAFKIIGEFQSENKHRITKKQLFEKIDDIIDFSFVDCDESTHQLLRDLRNEIKKIFRKEEYWLAPCHGDYKIGNLLFDKQRNITGIIDWDHFDKQCLPLYDHMTFVVQLVKSRREDVNSARCFIVNLLPWDVDEFINDFVQIELKKFNINEREFLAYRILYWFYNLKSRYLYRFTDNIWLREYFEIPIDEINIILKRNSLSSLLN